MLTAPVLPSVNQQEVDEAIAPFTDGVRVRAKNGSCVGIVISDGSAKVVELRSRGNVYGRFFNKAAKDGVLYSIQAGKLELIDEAAFAAFLA